MTLIKCPHCGHSVLSVASVCPTCNETLGMTFLGPEHGGELTECRACGHSVRSRSRLCPNCGVTKPAKRPLVSRPFINASLLVLIGAFVASVWPSPGPSLPRSVAVVEQKPKARPRRPVKDSSALLAAPAPAPPVRDTTQPHLTDSGSPLPDTTHSAGAAPSATLTPKWTKLWVNVRKRPQDTAPIMRVLRPGTRIDGSPRSYGWWLIFIEGDSVGYVAGVLLSSRPPTQSASIP